MQYDAVTRSYAGALFGIGVREGREEEHQRALELLLSLFDALPTFRTFLETPRIPLEEKKRVLRETLEPALPEAVMNFLLLLVDRGRERLLGDVVRVHRELVDEHQGRVRVEVEVAYPVDDETLTAISDRLSEFFGKEAIPQVRVNPELVGGVLFRRGDTVFDGSFRRRLRSLRKELLAADVSHEAMVPHEQEG